MAEKPATTSKSVLRITCACIVVIFIITLSAYQSASPPPPVAPRMPSLQWWTDGFPDRHSNQIIHCSKREVCRVTDKRRGRLKSDAYMFYASSIEIQDLPLPRNPDKNVWALYHEESPRNMPELMHEPFLKLFNYSATVSRRSNVPLTFQYLKSLDNITSAKYFVSTEKKNSYLNYLAPILYLQSQCCTTTERDVYVKELMKLIPVDSYGDCLNYKKLPLDMKEDYLNKLNDDAFLKFIARYKFVIAIENGVCDDYITEKFWRAIQVGIVPIYFGSPTIEDFFPNNKSAILLTQYPNPKLLVKYIHQLNSNDKLYEEYLMHKIEGVISNHILLDDYAKYPFSKDGNVRKFECFICNKIYKRWRGVRERAIVNESHYKCPKPISALSLAVNNENQWVHVWEHALQTAQTLFEYV